VQDQLPLSLIEEQAEGEESAEECGDDGEGDGLDEPDGAYVFLRQRTFFWLGCGAGHGEVLYRL